MLDAAYGARLDDTGRRYIERVRHGARRMGMLVDGLLGLARVSRTTLERREVDRSAVAREVIVDLAASDPGRDVAVEVAPGLAAWGDEPLLRVALANLLGNAWKYTRRTPDPRIAFEVAADGDEPVFLVRDNGAGFDMAHATRLFEAFQRLHTDSEFEGTGIGLATVERIVRRHGGRIWAEGTPGRGAIFRFTLPERQEDRTEQA